MSYTKGPWKVGNGLPPFYAWAGQILGKHEDGSEFILATCNQNYPEQAVENAHLIAAAPEMLEMLKECRDYLIESLNSVIDDGRPRYERQRQLIRDDMAKLDAIIAKAEGKETC